MQIRAASPKPSRCRFLGQRWHPNSPAHQLVRVGLIYGRGGTLIAASMDPELKCAMSFAAWQPAGGAMNKVRRRC